MARPSRLNACLRANVLTSVAVMTGSFGSGEILRSSIAEGRSGINGGCSKISMLFIMGAFGVIAQGIVSVFGR